MNTSSSTTITTEKLEQLRKDLAEFENKYNLSSQEFYRQFQDEKMDDHMDFVEWASLFQMADNLQK